MEANLTDDLELYTQPASTAIILLGLKLPQKPYKDPIDIVKEDFYYLQEAAMVSSLLAGAVWTMDYEKTGKAVPFIITGGTKAGDENKVNEASEMARYILKYYPHLEPYIILEEHAMNTDENAANSNDILTELVKTGTLSSKAVINVITRPDHAPRAEDIFAEVAFRNLSATANMPYLFKFLDESDLVHKILDYVQNAEKTGITNVYKLQDLVERNYNKRLVWPGIFEVLFLRHANQIPFTKKLLHSISAKTRS